MHDMSHSMFELQIVWNVDVCVVPLHVHFRWGVAFVEEFNYWALLTSSQENIFRYQRYLGRGDTSKTLVKKRRPDLALFLYFENYGKKT